MKADRIVFAGSPAFAAVQLQALLDAGAPLVGVLSQPDRPAGRGKRLQSTMVKQLAQAGGLRVATPPGLRRAGNRIALEAMRPDLIIVSAYGLLLPAEVLALPRLGCINVHASLLPRWRGAAPVERAMMAGDRETGVCIMQMDVGLDTGPVLHRRSLAIPDDSTGGELEAALARLGAAALLEVLEAPARYPPQPQPEEGVCHAPKLTRVDARIDFHGEARFLARQILALNPRLPVAVTTRGEDHGPLRLRLLRASVADMSAEDAAGEDAVGEDAVGEDTGGRRATTPGTVLRVAREGLYIATGAGVLCVHQAQLVGGKGTVLDGAGLLNALTQRLRPGAILVADQ